MRDLIWFSLVLKTEKTTKKITSVIATPIMTRTIFLAGLERPNEVCLGMLIWTSVLCGPRLSLAFCFIYKSYHIIELMVRY